MSNSNSCFCCGENNHTIWICHNNYDEDLVIEKIGKMIVEECKNFDFVKNLFNSIGFRKCRSISRKFGYLTKLPNETHTTICTTELFIRNGISYDTFLSNDMMCDETIHDLIHNKYIPEEFMEITEERNGYWERFFSTIPRPLFLGLMLLSSFDELVRKSFRDRELILRNIHQQQQQQFHEEMNSVSQINLLEDYSQVQNIINELPEIHPIANYYNTNTNTNTNNSNNIVPIYQNLINNSEEYYNNINLLNPSMINVDEEIRATLHSIFDQVIRWVDINLKYTPIPIEEWGENLPQMECCICFEDKGKNECISLNCRHTLCSVCTPTLITNHSNSCPLCRTKITSMEVYSQEVECMIQREEIRVYKSYFDR